MTWRCPFCKQEFEFFGNHGEEDGLGFHLYMNHEGQLTKEAERS